MYVYNYFSLANNLRQCAALQGAFFNIGAEFEQKKCRLQKLSQ